MGDCCLSGAAVACFMLRRMLLESTCVIVTFRIAAGSVARLLSVGSSQPFGQDARVRV